MRAIYLEKRVDRRRNAAVVILRFKLAFDRRAAVVARDVDEHAVDALLIDGRIRRTLEGGAVERGCGDDDDLFAGLRVKSRKALVELRHRRGREHPGALLYELYRRCREHGHGGGGEKYRAGNERTERPKVRGA